MRDLFGAAVAAAMSISCSSSSSPGAASGATSSTASPPPPPPALVPPSAGDGGRDAALSVVSLTSTTTVLTGGAASSSEADTVTFVAIVTDAKGLDNIAGGQLLDDAGTTYGAFGTGSTKGTYASTVSWTQVNQGRPIEHGTSGGTRVFVAKFFDNDGNVASASLSLSLHCRIDAASLGGACGGTCTTLDVGDHCGTCAPCAKGKTCASSSCTVLAPPAGNDQTPCTPAKTLSTGSTCGDVCAATGRLCYGGSVSEDATCKSYKSSGVGCSDDLHAASAPYFTCICGF